MIPTETIDTLVLSWLALSDLGAQLSENEWKAPTDLPGWSVQDNLAHLLGVERMMQGLPPTAHRATPREYVRNPIGEANEHVVDSMRELSGAEVLRQWNELVEVRTRTLRAGDDAHFAREMITPTGPGTLADFLSIRILDCWLHEQDMRRAVGRPGHMSGPAAEHTVDRLIRTVPIIVGKRAGTPEGAAVVIDITNGVDRHVVCEVSDGRAKVVAQPSTAPLATITLTTETFIVLAAGRRTVDQVAATVAGDTDLACRVLSQFNMMI